MGYYEVFQNRKKYRVVKQILDCKWRGHPERIDRNTVAPVISRGT